MMDGHTSRDHQHLQRYRPTIYEQISRHLVKFFRLHAGKPLGKVQETKMEWDVFLGGRDESERRRAESQWIVAARPLCHLQYPVAYLSRLQRILPAT